MDRRLQRLWSTSHQIRELRRFRLTYTASGTGARGDSQGWYQTKEVGVEGGENGDRQLGVGRKESPGTCLVHLSIFLRMLRSQDG